MKRTPILRPLLVILAVVVLLAVGKLWGVYEGYRLAAEKISEAEQSYQQACDRADYYLQEWTRERIAAGKGLAIPTPIAATTTTVELAEKPCPSQSANSSTESASRPALSAGRAGRHSGGYAD